MSRDNIEGMNIPEYLEKHRISQDEFGSMIGVTQGAVSQWLAGSIKISAERAVDIEKATKGEVKREEIRPDIFDRDAA